MGRFILAIIAFAMVVAVIKMVIVGLIIAGLIFRTQITIGLLCLGGIITLIGTNPPLGIGLVVVLIIVAVVMAKKNPPNPELDDPAQE